MAVGNLQPYPAYKDSGVPWLGRIPAHWDVARNGRLFVRRNEPGAPDLPILEVSLKTGVRVRRFTDSGRKQVLSDASGYRRAVQGDIAYNMMRMWQGAVGVAPTDGLVSPAYIIAHPLAGTHGKYYAYLFRTGVYMEEVDKYSRGIVKDRNRLYWEDFKQISSVCPPPGEQSAIVRLLDHVDRGMRRYVQAKRTLIAALNDRKQAIIHRAVTRGLDPKVTLKPSGADWLGDIPAHWHLVPIRALLRRIDQGVSPQAEALLAKDGGWGVLKAGCVNHGIFRDREHKRLPDGFSVEPSLAVKVGDVLVSRASGSSELVGSVGRVHSLRYRLILSDKTFRLVFSDERVVDFVVAAMNSRYFRVQVEQAISGAHGLAKNLPLSSLKAFRVALPPLGEAIAIAEVVKRDLHAHQRLVDALLEEIQRTREYQTRLIVDVVSGKLDVRAAAAKLPDEPDDAVVPDETEMESDGEVEDVDAAPSTIDGEA